MNRLHAGLFAPALSPRPPSLLRILFFDCVTFECVCVTFYCDGKTGREGAGVGIRMKESGICIGRGRVVGTYDKPPLLLI